jgi:hypothetical protein
MRRLAVLAVKDEGEAQEALEEKCGENYARASRPATRENDDARGAEASRASSDAAL